MKNISDYLLPGETVDKIVSVHEVVFIPPLMCLIGAILFFLFFTFSPVIYGFCVILLGTFWMIYALQRYVAHKLILTNQRLLVHYGLIKEGFRGVTLNNVVAAHSEQGRIARFLGYGKIEVMTKNGDRYGYPTFSEPNVLIDAMMKQMQKVPELATKNTAGLIE
jgi:uncharacterized membrane protein YdbT with pleckstrin-like domain